MDIRSLRPARDFASKYGAKSLVYGPPGIGKTPVANTAPRPLLCVTEPGLFSMKTSQIPTWIADTPAKIDEFFAWLKTSNETKVFDTICIDSISEMASIYLRDALGKTTQAGNKAHGQAAYGKMGDKVLEHLNFLFHVQNKHTYLICKLDIMDTGFKRPSFPGRFLNTEVPHLYDIILHIDTHNIPGVGQYRAFRTAAAIDALARDRSGKLNEFEPCDLTALFNKAMS